jgi:amino acid adenylation domain-containing protein
MQNDVIEGFRLSAQQKRLWALQQDSSTYRAQCAIQLSGRLETGVLKQALQSIINRHDILRTTFHRLPGMRIPIQVVADYASLVWREDDLTHLDASARELRVEEEIKEDGHRRFDFEQAPLLTTTLLKVSADDHVLILTLPALCADAHTLNNLTREISDFYAAGLKGEELPGDPLQYAHYSEWQDELLDSEEDEEVKAYWRDRLPTGVALPYEKRACANPCLQPESLGWKVEPELLAQVEAAAQKFGVSTPIFLMACWQMLLWRLTGEPDIVIGSVFDGRKYEELHGTAGLFAKCLSISCHFDGASKLSDILRQVRDGASEAYEQQDYFLWEEGDGEDASISTFPQAFEFAEHVLERNVDGLSLSVLKHYTCIDRFKIKLTCVRTCDWLELQFHYDPDSFEVEGVKRLAQQYRNLVSSAARGGDIAIGELDLLGDHERNQLLLAFNDSFAEFPGDTCAHRLFERHVERSPDHPAVVFRDQSLTYAQLNEQSNQLAHYLRELGVGPDSLVAIFMERSPRVVVALMAVLKAGGAYLPLDPEYPKERLAYMIGHAGVSVLLTESQLVNSLPEHAATVVCLDTDREAITSRGLENPSGDTMSRNLAYVIYTSGTTGKPKGVMIEHRGVANLASWQAHNFGITQASRILQFFSYSFDGAVGETFMALLNGATLVMLDPDYMEASKLIDFINEQGVTICVFVPSMLKQLDPDRLQRPEQLTVVSVGETCSADLATRWLTRCNFMNAYGPTENTVYSHLWKCRQDAIESFKCVPIGQVIDNTRSLILDENLNLVPVGVVGEIYITGTGVARGYLNDPVTTALKFIPNRFANSKGSVDRGALVMESACAEIDLFKNDEAVLQQVEKCRRQAPPKSISPDTILELIDNLPADLIEKTRSFLSRYADNNCVYEGFCRYFIEAVEGSYASCGINKEVLEFLFPYEAAEGMEGIDFCFGNGEIMQILSSMGVRMKGIDLSPFFVQKAREKGLDAYMGKVDVPEELLESEFGIAPGSQDFAISTLALDRLEAPRRFLRNFMLVLKEGGRFAIQTLLPISGIGDGDDDEPIVYTPKQNRICTGESVEQDKQALVALLSELGAADINVCRLPYAVASRDGIQDYTVWCFFGRKRAAAFAGESDDRLYRTGDLGRYLPDGSVEFMGRIDTQVKIRGFRIELEEIESALRQSPLIQDAVVVVREDVPGDKRLAAYVVAGSKAGNLTGELRGFLGERLPKFMMPSAFVALDQLPLTPNGKIDRNALPAPDQVKPLAEKSFVAPRTPTEEVLASIWSEVLDVEPISVTDNFFDLGGHSLLGTQVASRVREAFKVEIPLRKLFELPTVAGLAQLIEVALREDSIPLAPSIVPVPRAEKLPLSFAQQRLWFLDQLEPNNPFYNNPGAVRLRGALNIAAFGKALNEIVRRHEILRTSFPAVMGQPVQFISPPVAINFPKIDLSELAEGQQESEVMRLAKREARQPFDLARGPMLRVTLLRLAEQDYVLLFTMHHIVSDGWSLAVLINELTTLYDAYRNGDESPLPDMPIQYADFAHWQRQWLQGEVLEAELAYWKQQLADIPAVINLPTDRPRPAVQTYNGSHQTFYLSADASEQLRALSRREGVTLFMSLLAACQVALRYLTGQDMVVVGTDIANRNRGETEGLIGFFINQLVLCSDLSGDPTFTELLGRVRETTLKAYAHQDLPFDKLVDALKIERSLQYSPLFQVKIVLQNVPSPTSGLTGLSVSSLSVDTDTARFDILLIFGGKGQELVAELSYNADLFDPESIARIIGHLQTVAQEVTARPDIRLSEIDEILAGKDKQRLISNREAAKQVSQQKLKQAKRKNVS